MHLVIFNFSFSKTIVDEVTGGGKSNTFIGQRRKDESRETDVDARGACDRMSVGNVG